MAPSHFMDLFWTLLESPPEPSEKCSKLSRSSFRHPEGSSARFSLESRHALVRLSPSHRLAIRTSSSLTPLLVDDTTSSAAEPRPFLSGSAASLRVLPDQAMGRTPVTTKAVERFGLFSEPVSAHPFSSSSPLPLCCCRPTSNRATRWSGCRRPTA